MHHRHFPPCGIAAFVITVIGALVATRTGGVAFAQGGASAADASLIAKGRYLATAGDCISCHTRPGGAPFSGGRPMQTDFGTLYTPNITSDEATGIGRWTEEQVARAMHEGIDNAGHYLYPVFPYTSYTKVSDADVRAIYAFLRSLPPVRYTPPKDKMKFPFSIRQLTLFWRVMYFTRDRFVSDPKHSVEWNRGAYLVQGLEHCGECHTPRNSLGGPEPSRALAGGTYLDGVTSSVDDDGNINQESLERKWAPVNLTSSPTGLGEWSVDDIQNYLKTGHSRRAGAFGPMAEVVHNSTRYLTDEDVHAMAVYLKSLPAQADASGKPITPEELRAGRIAYSAHCATCHLPTGLGVAQGSDPTAGKPAPRLVGDAIVQAPDPASFINVILYGVHADPEVPGSWPRMPGFQDAIGFEDEQIAALCDYIRSSWGNRGDAVSPDDVARQR